MILKTVLLLVFGFPTTFTNKGEKLDKLSPLRTGEKTDHHESFTSKQTALVNLLQSQVSNHESQLRNAYNLIHQQSKKLSEQEHVLHQQAEALNKQEKLVQHLLSEYHHLYKNADFPSHVKGKYNVREDRERDSEALKVTQAGRKKSSSHLQTRSDDNGPLQVLIDHLSQQITVMGAEILALRASYHKIENVQASTFVHWGSSTCSDMSQLVYSGVAGGSYYSHTGGGSNYLCLTLQPVPSNHTKPAGMAYLYGSEFYTYDAHANKDPACAVCRSRFSTTVMIPGTNVCSPGWQMDYEGFLMAGSYGQAGSTQYICVDSKMESRVGGDATLYGMAMYYTVTQCGSLPCEPYENNKVATCAVCSK